MAWPVGLRPPTGLGATPLISAVPNTLMTILVGRYLGASMRARRRAAQWDAVYSSVGSRLLGVTDAAEIRAIAWTAVAELCAVTPGLRVLRVVRDGALLRVGEHTGRFAHIPTTLPALGVPAPEDGADIDGAGRETRGYAGLDAAAGARCAWSCVLLPAAHAEGDDDTPVAWLLLGRSDHVPVEATAAVRLVVNQVTLARRTGAEHRELTVQATRDHLTGLANRTTYNAALAADLGATSNGPTTVLFVDLDDFKDVNDVFGHGVGDDLLRDVAARPRDATRPGDLCGRLGGDEFAVLLRHTDAVTAAEVAQRIVETISAPMELAGRPARVGASVGVATATRATELEDLVHRADVAMYAAKARGGARIQVFDPALLRRGSTGVSFERQLAVAAEHEELVVHYQPIVSLADGHCAGAEALVRWQHPERGLLAPDEFIAVAERSGAIRDVGGQVLRRACTDAAAWRAAHPDAHLAVHVNVSARQLDDADLPAGLLVLELTESVQLTSPLAVRRLRTLAGRGITIAIDDFGTGYSPLTLLGSLPVGMVKLDKTFMAGAVVDPADRAVIEAVVGMAARLGMHTVAEGVERIEQEEFLASIGADGAQGYRYLRPTAARGFAAWLAWPLSGVSVAGARRGEAAALVARQSA